ncbi:uncharacterized protein XM38_032790 [Halomicronema hongdechloris C2206]|uniref:Uncharacterized protein n=1 Tax=Halomicronema hongdechloris C2206 TaxID=1641165 RepID=A0A1Z3HPZ6_9CYAN|nr:hypothetical protein [Halomicronema hongdechloris]ASC72322.1 uncharacterized protein XM38_032790 [Halomicronema hongdechloris C2206]
MEERLNMRGQLILSLSDRSGQMIHQQHPKNRIVLSGRRLVAQLFGGVESGVPAPKKITQMAVGTDGTDPNDDQTNLLAERSRKAIAQISYEETLEAGVKRLQASITAEFNFEEANGDDPLREAAILNEDGVMYNRVVFEPVTKTNAFKLTLLWRVVF